MEYTVSNWSAQRLRVTTPHKITVPPEDDNHVVIRSIMVVPTSAYRPPGSDDRWGGRSDLEYGGEDGPAPYQGEIIVRYDSAPQPDSVLTLPTGEIAQHKEDTQFRAGILSLADCWHRLSVIDEQSGVAHAGKLLAWMQRRIGSDYSFTGVDVEALQDALELAEISWQEYRAHVAQSMLDLAIQLPPGSSAVIERRESGWIPGPGPVIEAPVEVELGLLVKTPVTNPPEFIKRQIEAKAKAAATQAVIGLPEIDWPLKSDDS